MLKRVTWKLDGVLSVKLRDNLYTLAQMRENSLMQFFDIRSSDGQWHDLDLSAVEPLFCIYVAEARMKPILDAVVKESMVKPNLRAIPRRMLSSRPLVDSKYKSTVNLVELDDSYQILNAKLLKSNLVPSTDSADLQRYELAGMWGSPEQLATRLIRYFDSGVDWNDTKSYIFGDDLRPPSLKSS